LAAGPQVGERKRSLSKKKGERDGRGQPPVLSREEDAGRGKYSEKKKKKEGVNRSPSRSLTRSLLCLCEGNIEGRGGRKERGKKDSKGRKKGKEGYGGEGKCRPSNSSIMQIRTNRKEEKKGKRRKSKKYPEGGEA